MQEIDINGYRVSLEIAVDKQHKKLLDGRNKNLYMQFIICKGAKTIFFLLHRRLFSL